MSKQADEETQALAKKILLSGVYPGNLKACVNLINHLVEQRCLEARIDEHNVIDEYLGSDQDTPRGRRRIIFCEDLPVRQGTIQAQLTSLQNKEDE